MAKTEDYTPIITELTKETVNGIITGVDNISSSIKEIGDITSALDILTKQMVYLETTVSELSSLVSNVSAKDINTIDKSYGAKLSSKFSSVIAPLEGTLYTVQGVTELVQSIKDSLKRLDSVTYTLSTPVNSDGSDREVTNALTSLDPKTAIDLYLTLYARKKNLVFLRDKLTENLNGHIDSFSNNLKQANNAV